MDNIIPDSTPQFKQCYACVETFPATKEYFQSHNQKKDGLSPRCKTCISTGRKPHKRDSIPEDKKRCSKCTRVFDATLEFFNRHSQIKSGLNPACKECARAASREYEATHAESIKESRNGRKKEKNERQRQYVATHKEEIAQKRKENYQLNKEKILAERKRYVEANKEEVYKQNNIYREEHREELNKHNREYAKTDQGRVVHRASNHKRKAIKKATPGTLTAEQIQVKLKAQKGRCYYSACGHAKFVKENGKYIYHIEHTIPLSRTELNPRHDPNFTVLACPACNLSKHDKAPWEWNEGGRLF